MPLKKDKFVFIFMMKKMCWKKIQIEKESSEEESSKKEPSEEESRRIFKNILIRKTKFLYA